MRIEVEASRPKVDGQHDRRMQIYIHIVHAKPISFLSYLQHDFVSWTALQAAAREGHDRVVDLLLQAGAKVDEYDMVRHL